MEAFCLGIRSGIGRQIALLVITAFSLIGLQRLEMFESSGHAGMLLRILWADGYAQLY